MVKAKLKYAVAVMLLTGLLLPLHILMAAEIQVHMDRDTVEEGESFNLVFTALGDADGEPDFSPIEKDFRILQRSQRSNIQFINGELSSSKKWLFMLMPKKAGKIFIPSIRFGRDRTDKQALTVNKTTAAMSGKKRREMFLEVEATPKTVYVQSQILYTIRIYHSNKLVNASLSEVRVSDKNAILEKLGEDIRYEKQINGTRYTVFEKRFAIFPQTSGPLTISPVQFEGQFVNKSRNLSSKLLTSDQMKLDIKPQPQGTTAGTGNTWLPAASFEVSETWSEGSDNFRVGEPVTRTITMTATGLMAEQFPELRIGKTRDIKMYPDQPQILNNKTKSGIVGLRQEKIAYIPTRPGVYQLPELTIPWWNTEKNRQEIARIAAYEIRVRPGVNESPDASPGAQDVSPASGNLHEADSVPSTRASLPATTTFWFWVSMIFMSLWMFTLIFWWKGRGNNTGPATTTRRQVGSEKIQVIEKKIRKASHAGNAIEVKNLLIAWAARQWPEKPPTSLGGIARNCTPALSNELNRLNDALYGNNATDWDGAHFWAVFTDAKSLPPEGIQPAVDELQPLFRHSV